MPLRRATIVQAFALEPGTVVSRFDGLLLVKVALPCMLMSHGARALHAPLFAPGTGARG
jgi:hypothetical protein